MFLQYLFAAISALLPLLPMFRRNSFVHWTKGLASSMVPRYLTPPPRFSLSGAIPAGTAEDIDFSLISSAVPLSGSELDLHPAFHTILSIWNALVPSADVYLPTLRVYFPTILMCLLSCLGAYWMVSALKPSNTVSSEPSMDLCDPIASLEIISQLGHSSTVEFVLFEDENRSTASPVTITVTVTPPDNDADVEVSVPPSPQPLAQPGPHLFQKPVEGITEEADPRQDPVVAAAVDEVSSDEDNVLAEHELEPLREYVLVDLPSVVEISETRAYQEFVELAPTDETMNAAIVVEPAQVPLPLSPVLLPVIASLDLSALQEVTLLDNSLDLKEEKLLDVELSEIDQVEISVSNDILALCPSDLVTPDDLMAFPAEPSATMDWDLFSTTFGSPDEAPEKLPGPEECTPDVSKLTTNPEDFCFNGPKTETSAFSLDPLAVVHRPNLISDYSTISSLAEDASMRDIFSAFRCAYIPASVSDSSSALSGSLSSFDISGSDSDDFVIVRSPDLDDIPILQPDVILPCVPLEVSSEFPTMEPDEAVQSILGESLDRYDWTFVNIHLNEEGRYLFAAPSVTVPADVSAHAVAHPQQQLVPRSMMVRFDNRPSIRHSRSGSEDLRRQPGTALLPTGPRSIVRLFGDSQYLSMRLGLIQHERDYHMFEPTAELRIAVQSERTALSLATIPRMRPFGPGRLNYGLTQAEFLGILANVQHFIPGISYSYAERLRHNLPQNRSLTYTRPPTLCTEGASASSIPMIVHVNKNRGGQEVHLEAANQVELDRQAAKAVSDRPFRRFRIPSDSRRISLGTTPRRASMATATLAVAGAAFAGSKGRASSEPPETTQATTSHTQKNLGNARRPHELRKTKSSVAFGASRSKSGPSQERNHHRSSSGPRSSCLAPAPTVAGPRRGRRSTGSISQPPPLETIAGSPPDSPKNQSDVPRRQFASFETAAKDIEAVPSFISFGQSSSGRATSSRFGPAMESFARIDDDGVSMKGVQERFDRPASRGTHRR
ncbi:hypothetical protein BXZ70DRAFT_944476 [Cristinia sonorae]|uniref:Uncharacterized protein n=1 Tax=Cristinia sonorae TaxID=1940300 RepID=A0A8K0UMN7_9AGAR|nr:hypothetical protein BXZ70DRAFT_944476 [Cristinia sonorae]